MKCFLFVLLFVFSFLPLSCQNTQETTARMVVGQKEITVEIADTPETRQRGLMFRESLPEDSGMLFVFPQDEVLTFWMKDTSIPLSIAYIDQNGVIMTIKNMYPFDLTPVSSDVPVRYALEMNQNFFSRNAIRVGDRVILPEQLR